MPCGCQKFISLCFDLFLSTMFINFDNIGFFAGEPSLSLSFSPLEFFLEDDSSSSSSVVTRLSVSSSWSLFLNSQFWAMVRLSTFCAKAEAENFLLDGLSMVLPGSWLCTSSRSIRKICPESAEDDLSGSLSRVSSSLPSWSQTCKPCWAMFEMESTKLRQYS